MSTTAKMLTEKMHELEAALADYEGRRGNGHITARLDVIREACSDLREMLGDGPHRAYLTVISGQAALACQALASDAQPASEAPSQYKIVGWVHPIYLNGNTLAIPDVSRMRLSEAQVPMFICVGNCVPQDPSPPETAHDDRNSRL